MKKVFILLVFLFSVTFSNAESMPTPYGQVAIPEKSVSEKDSIIKQQMEVISLKNEDISKIKQELAKAQAKSDLFGGIPPISYLVGFVFALIGILINTTIITKRAIKKDEKTPPKFDFMFWLKDNQVRVTRWVGIMAVIFIGMRFSNEILDQKFTMFLCFLLGLLIDSFIEYLKNLKITPKN